MLFGEKELMLEFLENATSSINDALYSYILVAVLVAGGIYFTIRTRFVQFRLLKEQVRCVTEKPKDASNRVKNVQRERHDFRWLMGHIVHHEHHEKTEKVEKTDKK